jgi:hypothetical protein
MRKAIFNSDWHGVSAGTKVRIRSSYRDVQDNEIFVVERVDGQLLPSPYGEAITTNVAPEFLDIIS